MGPHLGHCPSRAASFNPFSCWRFGSDIARACENDDTSRIPIVQQSPSPNVPFRVPQQEQARRPPAPTAKRTEPLSVAGAVGAANHTRPGAELRARRTAVAILAVAQNGTSGALAQDDSSARSNLTFCRRLQHARAIELARPGVPAPRAITVQMEYSAPAALRLRSAIRTR
jgi:hypothetical protein